MNSFLIRKTGSCAEISNLATEQLSYCKGELHELSIIGVRLTLVLIDQMVRKKTLTQCIIIL